MRGRRYLYFLIVIFTAFISGMLGGAYVVVKMSVTRPPIGSAGQISRVNPPVDEVDSKTGNSTFPSSVISRNDAVAQAEPESKPVYPYSAFLQNYVPSAADDQAAQQFAINAAGYTQKIRSAISFPMADSGLLLSTTTFPSAGRLMRRPVNGGDISTCSGALVGKRYFVTAAHCFCEKGTGHWPDYQSCMKADAPNKSVSVVSFPASGADYGVAKITINPLYQAIDEARDSDQPLGDIAIVELDRDVPLPSIALGSAAPGDMAVVAGFGVLDMTKMAMKKIRIAGGPYAAGIEAVFFPLLQSCANQFSQPDIVCANYSDFNMTPGSATCGGDSGAAMFKLTAAGHTVLAGIASSRKSRKKEQVCDSEDNVLSVFTDVSAYKDWIEQAISEPAGGSAQNRLEDCQESVTSWDPEKGGQLMIHNTAAPAHVSITSAGFYDQGLQPALSSMPSDYCVHVMGHQGLFSCELPANANLAISVKGRGILQFTSCHQRNRGGPR